MPLGTACTAAWMRLSRPSFARTLLDAGRRNRVRAEASKSLSDENDKIGSSSSTAREAGRRGLQFGALSGRPGSPSPHHVVVTARPGAREIRLRSFLEPARRRPDSPGAVATTGAAIVSVERARGCSRRRRRRSLPPRGFVCRGSGPGTRQAGRVDRGCSITLDARHARPQRPLQHDVGRMSTTSSSASCVGSPPHQLEPTDSGA